MGLRGTFSDRLMGQRTMDLWGRANGLSPKDWDAGALSPDNGYYTLHGVRLHRQFVGRLSFSGSIRRAHYGSSHNL